MGIADGPGTGVAANGAYPSGTFGYDISRFQDNPPACNQHAARRATPSASSRPPGRRNGSPNPCLAHEAQWAGGGLNLYIFMTYGTDTTDQPGLQRGHGLQLGLRGRRLRLPVRAGPGREPPRHVVARRRSGQLVVQHGRERPGRAGRHQRLARAGVNNVGIYTSPLTWNGIAGDFQPAVPLWVAWYTNDPQGNCANAVSYAAQNGNFLPTGGGVGHPVHQPGQRRRASTATTRVAVGATPRRLSRRRPGRRPALESAEVAGGRRRCSGPGASPRRPSPTR